MMTGEPGSATTDELDGRVCLVTGAVDGIGFATARHLAGRGATVVLGARVDDDRLAARVDELQADRGRVEAVVCDVTDAAQVTEVYRRIQADHKRLDVLVANAGILGDARLGMITEDQLDEVLDVNLKGAIRHLQGAARLMTRLGSGSIVVVSSIIGLRGNPGQVPYAAAKAGVVGAVRSAAKELAPAGIRVNAVAPGYIDTPMTAALPDALRAERLNQIGMGRAGRAEEVAAVIGFLAGDGSSYVTGQVIGVDGGMVI